MKETVECWLTFAREDLRTAEVLLENEIYSQSCFHVQQCVEKALKALLIHHRGHMPPKTHVIADLMDLLPSEWFIDLEADISETMESYYIATRYPDALPSVLPEGLPGKAEAEEAIVLARIVLEKADQLIQISE